MADAKKALHEGQRLPSSHVDPLRTEMETLDREALVARYQALPGRAGLGTGLPDRVLIDVIIWTEAKPGRLP